MTGRSRPGPAWPAIVGGSIAALAVALSIAAMVAGVPVAAAANLAVTAAITTPSLAVGLLLIARRPRVWVGAQLTALGGVPLITTAGDVGSGLAGTGWPVIPAAITSPLWFIAPLLLALTFPTGGALTARWRPVLWAVPIAAGVLTAGLAVAPDSGQYDVIGPPRLSAEPVTAAVQLTALVALLILAASAFIAVTLRSRRGDDVVRLQLRWLGLGFLILPIGLAAALVSVAVRGDAAVIAPIALTAAGIAIPAAVWVAVTRHGLYELGRVVSRAVAYTSVSLLSIGVYAAVVTSATWLLPGASSIAVAGATLAAAAVFFPVLRGIRKIIDRRFDRAGYDAQRVVDIFGRRLREDVDPATTARDLAQAVERTLQPTSVGLWAMPRAAAPRDLSLPHLSRISVP